MTSTAINWAWAVGVLTYVGSALIGTMPAKDSDLTWRTIYCWAYDALHMMLNSRPTQGPQAPNTQTHKEV